MTCPSDGENMIGAANGFLSALANFPLTAGLMGGHLRARAQGEVYTPSLWDWGNATNINNALFAGIGQALGVTGSRIVGAAVERTPDAIAGAQAYEAARQEYDRQVDANPNGGPGPCDEDPNPNPNPNPNPDPNAPPPGDPRFPPPGGPGGPGGVPGGPGGPGGPGSGPNPGRTPGDPLPGLPPRPTDPLVIDLNGDGVRLTAITSSNAFFDFDGDGFRENTGWVDSNDGLLAFDRNGNGVIDDGTELFGSATVDGFDAVRALDSNLDGRIDTADADFGSLSVWRDLDGDGLTDAGELFSLQSLGIESIGLTTSVVNETRLGNYVARTGTVEFTDGRSTNAESVHFAVDRQNTAYVPPEDFEYVELALWLPQLRGYGTVRDLAVAMSEDPDLLADLRQLVLDSDGMPADIMRARVEALVVDWVGASEIPAGTRGAHVDYAKLAVLESFWGQPFWEQIVSAEQANMIDDLYADLIDRLAGRVVAQMSSSYYFLAVLEGRDVDPLGHSLAAFGVFDYAEQADTLSGRIDLFLPLATWQLSGSHLDQLTELEALLDYMPMVSTALFNGEGDYFGRFLAGLVSTELNFSSLSNVEVFALIAGDGIFGSAGADTLAATADQRSVFGLEGNDVIIGVDTADNLLGGEGDDQLNGGKGDDLLDGGAGDDLLSGGGGDDMYTVALGDGNDVVDEYTVFASGWGGVDTIQFLEGIASSDVSVSRANNDEDIVLTIISTGQTITIRDGMFSLDDRIERVAFADGTVWTYADLVAFSQATTSGDDTLYGADGSDELIGGAGDDVLVGRSGDDVLEGGTGDDHLSGDDGDDTYRFELGDGHDIIAEASGRAGFGGNDTIELGAGIAPGDVTVTQADNGRDLVISFGVGDSITITDALINSDMRIEQVVFADGTIWSHAALLAQSLIPTADDDALYGAESDDMLTGDAGNDVLVGRAGHDSLSGGVGNDMLSGDAGDDTYHFARGDGQDLIVEWSGDPGGWGGNDRLELSADILPDEVTVTQANNGRDLVISIGGGDSITIRDALVNSDMRVEQLVFGNGTVWTHDQLMSRSTGTTPGDDTIYGSENADILFGGAGHDRLIGRAGNDVLTGGSGNDHLSGDAGDDTYVFGVGDGHDLITEWSGSGGWGGNDTLQLGAGILPDDVTVTQANGGADLVLTLACGESVTMRNANSNSDVRIEQVTFANGTVWSFADLFARSLASTEGNDTIYGGSTGDSISGGGGNDRLIGLGGNDILEGGSGDDHLSGDAGDDSYVFGLGDGHDLITEWSGNGGWGGYDTLQLGAGILPEEVVVTQANGGADLVLTLVSGETLTMRNAISNSDVRIEQVTFANGTVWSYADLFARSLASTEGADTIYGSNGADTISGDGGNDRLIGLGGNDVLVGGSGDDHLSGDAGDDIYVFDLGGGHDLITEWSGNGGWGGNDTLQLGAGILATDVTVTRANWGADLVLTLASGESVTMRNAISNSDVRIEQVTFADGTIWTYGDMLALSSPPEANMQLASAPHGDDYPAAETAGFSDVLADFGWSVPPLLDGIDHSRAFIPIAELMPVEGSLLSAVDLWPH